MARRVLRLRLTAIYKVDADPMAFEADGALNLVNFDRHQPKLCLGFTFDAERAFCSFEWRHRQPDAANLFHCFKAVAG
jgi:hypothetical protein